MLPTAIKIFLPAALAFLFGILITPGLTELFYKKKLWKKRSRSTAGVSDTFQALHNTEEEQRTPRVGGMIIWLSVLITTVVLFAISRIFPDVLGNNFEFISRNQTYIPLATLFIASLIGLIDDAIQIRGSARFGNDPVYFRYIKIGSVVLISLCIALWFFTKLDMSAIAIPFNGSLELGILFIPLFILVSLATFSSSVIDGIDGLSGGVIASIFASYAAIAFFNNQIDLAAFCAVVTGALLAFLWFNIPPARFYMGETGMVGLTITITTLAFLTDTVLILPIIALPLVLTSGSNIVQMISRSVYGKRVLAIAPLHHHLETIGWSRPRITMRYWIISVIAAVVGLILAVIS